MGKSWRAVLTALAVVAGAVAVFLRGGPKQNPPPEPVPVDTVVTVPDTFSTPPDTGRDSIPQQPEPPAPDPEPPALRPLAWGPFHEPLQNLNAGLDYTGTVRVMQGSDYKSILDSVAARGAQVGFYLTTQRTRFASKADPTKLDVQHWKAYVLDTIYGKRLSTIRPFIDDSTIKFVYMVDEYECASCWGGMIISDAQIDTLAMFTRQVFKGSDGVPLPVAVRVDPAKMYGYAWKYVDVSWAQYSGATHFPAAGPPLGQWAKKRAIATLKSPSDTLRIPLDSLYYLIGRAFADSMVKVAKAAKLGLILGVNTLDGGDGYSGIMGYTTHATRWIISPDEYYGVARAFLEQPYNCGSFNWKSSYSIADRETTTWDAARKAALLGFDASVSVVGANAKLRLVATRRDAGPCRVR